MATYNWSIRPGIENKYGFAVADSDDDVKPSNCTYVALFGNDITGNGSRQKPFKTIVRVQNTEYTNIIVASGVYREKLVGNTPNIYVDGDVVIDGEFTTDRMALPTTCYGLKLRGGFFQENIYYVNYYNCDFDGVSPGRIEDCYLSVGKFKFNTVKKITVSIQQENYIVPSYRAIENNTFYNSNIYIANINPALLNVFNMCIFVNCNINFCGVEPTYMTYCLFYNCRFKNINENVNRQLYPIIPPGFDDTITTIEELKTFLGTTEGLKNCIIANPKLNNPEVGDFSLAFDSPAKNMSYFGTFVGAQSIGYSIKANVLEDDGDFDFSTNINLNIQNNSITFIDNSQLASIETKVKPNLIGRELGKAPIYGFNADRNGQYIDSIEDLSNVTISPGNLLSQNTPYIVENASINYNEAVLQAGERFTTNNIQTFTSDGGGVVREIVEAPQRHTVLARFFNGGATKNAGDALTANYWYYVTGSITYNGNTYTDQVFKATDTSSFIGSGTVMEAMTNQTYQHYEPGIKFTSNNVGDVRTGEIIRGNGDPDYERGTNKEFAISARFIQIKYIIQPNNLKP